MRHHGEGFPVKSSVYVCTRCGRKEGTPLGYCPTCGSIGSFVPDGNGKEIKDPVPITAIPLEMERVPLGIPDLDGILGGGLPLGTAVLLGGEPEVWKSTLLLQIAASLAKRFPVLYASGEESPALVRERAGRIGALEGRLYFLSERSLVGILGAARSIGARALFVDSVQAVLPGIEHSAGSPQGIRAAAFGIREFAKGERIIAFLSSQVNKRSRVQGPRALEHLVDVNLLLEYGKGEERFLKVLKNRYGTAGLSLPLRMEAKGLVPAEGSQVR